MIRSIIGMVFAVFTMLIASHVYASTITADQGQIFNTDGLVVLDAEFHSQSVTTGISGQLTGIQVQFANISGLPNYPPRR